MKRVAEVRETRAARFYDERMKGKAGRERAAAKAQLENELHLVRAPASLRGLADAEAEAEEEPEAERMEAEAAMEEEAPAVAPRAARVRAPKLKVPAGARMRE
jgi:hypothetical protein